MKKILILLVVVLVAYYGYQVYLRNMPEEVPEPPYVLDENYMFSISFDSNQVSKLIYKTYYIYNDTKAVLEKKITDRSTGEYLETTYEEIEITDPNFSANSSMNILLSKDSSDISSIYRYKFYSKSTNKTLNLHKSEAELNKLLIMFGEEVDPGIVYAD